MRIGREPFGHFHTSPGEGDPLAHGKPLKTVFAGQNILAKLRIREFRVEDPRAKVTKQTLREAAIGVGFVNEIADLPAENVPIH